MLTEYLLVDFYYPVKLCAFVAEIGGQGPVVQKAISLIQD